MRDLQLDPRRAALLRDIKDVVNRSMADIYRDLRFLMAGENLPVCYALADQTIESSTTLEDDDELFLPTRAHGRYELRAGIVVNQESGGIGFKFGWTIPTGASLIANYKLPTNLIGKTTDTGVSIAGASIAGGSTADQVIEVVGTFIGGDADGVLQFQFAQASSSADTLTRRAVSWMRLDRLDR